MARIQSLKQSRFMETSEAPISNRQLEGGSFGSGGVPKMHNLFSSNPVFRASSLLHKIRIRTLKMPRLKY